MNYSYAITMIDMKSKILSVGKKSSYCDANESMPSQYD